MDFLKVLIKPSKYRGFIDIFEKSLFSIMIQKMYQKTTKNRPPIDPKIDEKNEKHRPKNARWLKMTKHALKERTKVPTECQHGPNIA